MIDALWPGSTIRPVRTATIKPGYRAGGEANHRSSHAGAATSEKHQPHLEVILWLLYINP